MNVKFEERLGEAAQGPAIGFDSTTVEVRVRRRVRRNRLAYAAACVALLLVGSLAVLNRTSGGSEPSEVAAPGAGLESHWEDELTGDRWVVVQLAAVAALSQNPWYDFEPDGSYVAFDGCDIHNGRWSLDPADERTAALAVELTGKTQGSPCQGTSSDLNLPTDRAVEQDTSSPVALDPIPLRLDDGRLLMEVPAITEGDTIAWGMERFDRLGRPLGDLDMEGSWGTEDLLGSGVPVHLSFAVGGGGDSQVPGSVGGDHALVLVLGAHPDRCAHLSETWRLDGDLVNLGDVPSGECTKPLADRIHDPLRVRVGPSGGLWIATDLAVTHLLESEPASENFASTGSVIQPSED